MSRGRENRKKAFKRAARQRIADAAQSIADAAQARAAAWEPRYRELEAAATCDEFFDDPMKLGPLGEFSMIWEKPDLTPPPDLP
jgi:hypothetical protein